MTSVKNVHVTTSYHVVNHNLELYTLYHSNIYVYKLVYIYRHGMCFRMSYVFVDPFYFDFHSARVIFRFLFLERKQDSNVTSVKYVQGCF